MTTRDSATFPRAIGERFAAHKMAENYQCRPPYSAEVFETLLGLIRDEPKVVLDAGCGPGKIARAIVDSVDRIDAVDPSVEMIRVGRSLPHGDNPKIRWLNGRIEDVALSPPYALIVAGASFRWMRPEIALRRFSEVISPTGVFAILDGDAPIDPPWASEEQAIMIDLVTKIEGKRPKWWMSAKQRIDLPLVEHPQFSRIGSKITAPMEFTQPVADYLRCLHSRATFSEEHLGEELSREFDLAIADLLSRYAVNGMVTYQVQTRLDWGRPQDG
jgi:SAM-dependent methyltransferase